MGRLGAARGWGPVALALSLSVAAGCTRTPPEATKSAPPANTATTSTEPIGTNDALAAVAHDRCVRPSPAQPPPAATVAPRDRCPRDPGGAPRLARAKLAFAEGSAGDGADAVAAVGTTLDAEIAREPADTERGLMYRMAMPEERGMIFSLGERKEHVFWMHNTCIPLDMLFVDDDGLIVGILENVPTLNEEERTVGCPSRWVIETNAGWSRRHGVRAGQHVKLPANL